MEEGYNQPYFGKIFKAHFQALCQTAFILSGDADETRKIVHECMIDLYRRLSSGTLHYRINTFLDYQVALRAIDFIRKKNSSPDADGLSAKSTEDRMEELHLIVTSILAPDSQEGLRDRLLDQGINFAAVDQIIQRRKQILTEEVKIEPDVNTEWMQFCMMEGLSPYPEKKPTAPEGEKKSQPRISFFRIAIAIGLAMIIYFVVQRLFFNESTPDLTEISTDGEVQQWTFGDGTMVWMNLNTTIGFEENYGQNGRVVELEGEAYFDVVSVNVDPFIVVTDDAEIRTRESKFNLRNIDDENLIILSVETGIATFNFEGQSIETVEGGTSLLFDRKTRKWEKRTKLSENDLAWKRGIIRFDDADLQVVFTDLERHFRISIDVEKQTIYNCEFSGAFHEPNIDDVMDVITNALKLKAKKDPDQNWNVSGQGCL